MADWIESYSGPGRQRACYNMDARRRHGFRQAAGSRCKVMLNGGGARV